MTTDFYGGAYGFRLIYTDGGDRLHDLVEQDPATSGVVMTWRLASTVVDHEHVDHERVSLGAKGASSFEVVRNPASIAFDFPETPSADAVLHPLGTIPMSVLARWRGDATLHGGAFAIEHTAWGLAGQREAGKSTTLALLSELGYTILADDLLAIQDGFVWSGPSCVDLRPQAAAKFPGARDLGIVGGRRRYRLSTPSAPARLPLRGFFFLEWHEEPRVTISPLPVDEKLRWLYALEYIGLMGPAPPLQILDLAALPAWRVARPRGWYTSAELIDAILAVAEGHA